MWNGCRVISRSMPNNEKLRNVAKQVSGVKSSDVLTGN